MSCYLQNYQTLIAGILGFSGVIIALLVNAWLTRKMEKDKIHRDANALRRALIEEMNVQREALTNTASMKARPVAKKADALIPIIRFSGIFDAAVDRLGLLELQEVAAVLKAYLALRQLTPKLEMIASRVPPHERGVEYREKPAEYILIGHGDVELVGKMHRSYVPAFDDAIEKLRSNLHDTQEETVADQEIEQLKRQISQMQNDLSEIRSVLDAHIKKFEDHLKNPVFEKPAEVHPRS